MNVVNDAHACVERVRKVVEFGGGHDMLVAPPTVGDTDLQVLSRNDKSGRVTDCNDFFLNCTF